MVLDINFVSELKEAKMSYDGYNVLGIKVN